MKHNIISKMLLSLEVLNIIKSLNFDEINICKTQNYFNILKVLYLILKVVKYVCDILLVCIECKHISNINILFILIIKYIWRVKIYCHVNICHAALMI